MIAEKPALSHQIGHIERSKAANWETGSSIGTEITSQNAQQAIFRPVTKQNCEINELWLSLAMKECFRHWTGLGRDIYGRQREQYIDRAIETYRFFTAVAERLETKKYRDLSMGINM